MGRRTFGRRAAAIAGAGMLVLAMSPHSFAQSAGSGRERLPTIVAENAVSADLSVSKDTASVSSAAAGAPVTGSYAPAGSVTASTAPVMSGMAPAAPSGLSSKTFPHNATMMTMPPGGPSSEVKAVIQELTEGTAAERRLYARAAAAFPHFCQEWARMLRDRETNNLSSLNWQEKSGYETASYVGYSPIKTCECKESAEGIPLGKVTYDEENYYVAGKTIDDAKHNPPKIVGVTHTLEIFSWDQNKWFY